VRALRPPTGVASARITRGTLGLAFATATVVLAATALQSPHPTISPRVPWWILGIVFAITEMDRSSDVDRGPRALTSPTSRIPLVIGLYFTAPIGLLAAYVVGAGVALVLRRARPSDELHRLAASLFATGLGAWAYLGMTDVSTPRGPEGWVDGIVAASVVVTVSVALVALDPRTGAWSHPSLWPRMRTTVLADVLAVATGLLAVEIIRTHRSAVWLLVLPAAAAYAARRQRERAEWRADALDALHHLAWKLQRAPDRDEAVRLAVTQARALGRGERAEIVLHRPDGWLRCVDAGPGPVLERGELTGSLGQDRERLAAVRGTTVDRASGSLLHGVGRWGRDRAVVTTTVIELGVVTGYLRLERRARSRPISRLEVSAIETLAVSLGVTLETLRSFDELEHRRERDAEVTVRLSRVNEELARVSDAKSVFLATTSHELRAPLTALLAETELLTVLIDDPDRLESCRCLVDHARSNARHLLRLVDDLLDLSRIEAGRLSLQMETVDLATVTAAAVSSLQPVFAADGVDLVLGRLEPTVMCGDQGRLRQVMTNLIQNASNATPAGGRVEVTVSADDHAAWLTVADTGRGIRPDQLERMFAPFEQGPDHCTGLGLGLTIARHLVEGHGGTLTATSVPGQGSCFTARFARTRDDGLVTPDGRGPTAVPTPRAGVRPRCPSSA
jgi:signal transduction histidine kinase/NO-binding membrane sensor protein with MHYT domain